VGAFKPNILNINRINDAIFSGRICISERGDDEYYENLYKYIICEYDTIEEVAMMNKLDENKYRKVADNNFLIAKFVGNVILNDMLLNYKTIY